MTATAHGMGREPVDPDWPPITEDEARAVLDAWGMESRGVAWRSPRPFSAAALVDVTGGEAVFVKRHHRLVRSSDALAVEHAFARHLLAGGQPVAEVIDRPGGTTTLGAGEWTYEVQRRAPGDDRYRDALAWTPYRDAGDARGSGAALARFHAAAAGWDHPGVPAGVLTGGSRIATDPDPMSAVARLVGSRPGLAAWLAGRDWEAQLGPLLEPWEAPPSGSGWGHGDWHATNLMWSGSEVAGIVDVGLAGPTGAEFDTAVAIERAVVGWLDLAEGRPVPVDWGGVAALLDGYLATRPLDLPGVARALPLAHVDFALSEVEYFAAVVGDPVNAELAWDGYLCGHLAWWAGPGGRRLIDEVQAGATR
ncbi:phosphotransferase [Acidiferrimicrobium sp. IK]|uniref:phosphotransferase n=1 Tax=Acidiferrimicrobium sp. IK TaxID=2871700 RepID=UPI0021CB5791|nr:phosphotransferase [Acidiferrimicrobium sp. IK]MCU4183947.1 phosphotransferase [Acidiferrimicrobium sp. IK]